jgi:hypothetical protein
MQSIVFVFVFLPPPPPFHPLFLESESVYNPPRAFLLNVNILSGLRVHLLFLPSPDSLPIENWPILDPIPSLDGIGSRGAMGSVSVIDAADGGMASWHCSESNRE